MGVSIHATLSRRSFSTSTRPSKNPSHSNKSDKVQTRSATPAAIAGVAPFRHPSAAMLPAESCNRRSGEQGRPFRLSQLFEKAYVKRVRRLHHRRSDRSLFQE